MSKEYKKSCSNCGQSIIMSLTTSGKWQPMETDNSTVHRCMSKKSDAAEAPTTAPKVNPIVENEIIALKNRVNAIENWIHKLSESWVMQS